MNWVNIDSDNGLPPVRRQAITWTNADLLPIGPLGTKFSEIQIKLKDFLLMKMLSEMSAILSKGRWVNFALNGNSPVIWGRLYKNAINSTGIPTINIGLPHNCLIFIMGIPLPGNMVFQHIPQPSGYPSATMWSSSVYSDLPVYTGLLSPW